MSHTFTRDELMYAAIDVKKNLGMSYSLEDIIQAAYDYLPKAGYSVTVGEPEVRYRIESNVRPTGEHWHVRTGAYSLECATGLLKDFREAAQAEGRSTRYRLVKVTRTMEVLDL